MRIVWREVEALPICCGHGVEFHSRAGADDEDFFAFLEGYDWMRSDPEEVAIMITAAGPQHDTEFLKAAKVIISQALRSETLKHGHVGGQVFAWFNA